MKNYLLIPIILLVFISCSRKTKIPAYSKKNQSKNVKVLRDTIISMTDSLSEENSKTAIELNLDSTRLSPESEMRDIYRNYAFNNEEIIKKTQIFYKENDYALKWLSGKEPEEIYYTFLNILENSDQFGLDPSYYNYEKLNNEIITAYASLDRKESMLEELELKITGLYFLFTTHLTEGRINNPGSGGDMWLRHFQEEEKDDIYMLSHSKNGKQLIRNVEELHPHFKQYELLQEALIRYEELEEQYANALFNIGKVDKIEMGQVNDAIPKIRRRLAATDKKVKTNTDDSLTYTAELQEAVRRFQDRHGLLEDGVIGPNTIRHLNISFSEKVEKIKLNMERYRWQHKNDYEDYVTVNIPEYKLRVYENGKMATSMKVIVGKDYTSTPVFTDTVQYIVFSPNWVVPMSIIEGEIIPRLKKNPSYYSGRDYVFYKNQVPFEPSTENWMDPNLNPHNYMVIQKPGPSNALGLVKFIMPNSMSVYMHDTPSDYLFERNSRALSHGCIRVEKPSVLAKELLKNNDGWNTRAVVESMGLDSPKRVNLKTPIPVEITYHTTWVDDNGEVHFSDDIYGHDEKQLQKLRSFNRHQAYLE